MSKKTPVIIGLVWLLAATALYGYIVWNGQPDGVYTYNNDGCMLDQKVYVTDNEKEEGLIYAMDLYGKVSDFFSTKDLKDRAQILQITEYANELYAVMAVPELADADAGCSYRILQFDQGLKLAALTPAISIYGTDEPTDLIADENGMYLACVEGDGSAACVYEIPYEQLLGKEEAAPASIKIESFLRQEAEAGHMYVDASYEMGAISVRSDADLVSGPFAIDDSIRYTYSLCHMSFGQLMSLHGNYRIFWLIGVCAGWLMIFLLYELFDNRNRVVYLAFVLECILLVVILGGSGMFVYRQVKLEEASKTKWISSMLGEVLADVGSISDPVFTDADFYTSEEYVQLRDRLEAAYTQTKADGCTDLFLADVSDLCIYVSADGHNRETVDARYFAAGSNEAGELVVANSIVSRNFTLDGQKYQILAATRGDLANGGYTLFGVYRDDAWSMADWQPQLVTALIVFALASMASILILSLQSSDLRKLARGMQQVAVGKTDIERPRVYGGDMRMLWNALGEIQNKIRKVNYSKFLAFEAYYRFAPKNIERLLNKESITEVTSGDVTKLQGTMAMISTVGPRSGSEEEIGRLNRLIALIGRYQEEKDGVFISNDGALSMLRFLFMDRNKNTLNSAADFLRELAEQEAVRAKSIPRTTILLHHSSFVYGVAGTNQQSSTFLVSPETDEIEHFAAWFRERGLRLVISETVKERENYDGLLRYIGYIQMTGSNKKMDMYEVLDALDVREREKKRAVCERFSQALELFYQHDFYLARSAFSDILKELPTDEIAKWYLFTCETYLNMEHAEDVPCCLRYEE